MRHTLAVVLALSVTSGAYAQPNAKPKDQDPPRESQPAKGDDAAKLRENTDKAIKDLEAQIKKRENAIAQLKFAKIDSRARGITYPADPKGVATCPSKEARDRAMAEVQARLDECKARLKELKGGGVWIGDLEYPVKVGNIGKLPNGDKAVNVVQVIDAKTMLVRVLHSVPAGVDIRGKPGSGQIAIPRNETKETILMVRDVSTAGAADGQGFALPQTFRVAGTETYKTETGSSRTVFVVKPMSSEELKGVKDKAKAAREQAGRNAQAKD
jgi:hypothetical protein